MLLQLTNAGAALMASETSPLVLDSYKIGTAFGYVPALSQTSLNGAVIYSATPSLPTLEGSNSVKYSVVLGPGLEFFFGEVGLYKGAVLVAVGVFEVETQKLALNTETDTGGTMVLDFHLPIVSTNYEMWASATASNSTLRAPSLQRPSELPSSRGALPNLYVIQPADITQNSYLAYTDRIGLWNFENFVPTGLLTISDSTVTSVTVPAGSEIPLGSFRIVPEGEIIIQFASGQWFSAVRYLTRVVPASGGKVSLVFSSPIPSAAVSGDKLTVYTKIETTPIATTTVLGKNSIATVAEVVTGTDNFRTVTAAGVKAAIDNLKDVFGG
jgi:hypothetical protein